MRQRSQLNALIVVGILVVVLLASSRTQCNAPLPSGTEVKSRPTKPNSDSPVEPDRSNHEFDARKSSLPVETGSKVLEGEVIYVADGDTITVRDADGGTHRIRLEGIDAPELRQAFGGAAKRELSSKVLRKRVRVAWKQRDQFDRILGHVRLGEHYINGELIEEGFAWRFRNYPNDEFVAAEARARNAKRGLWSDTKRIPPWQFRDQK